MKRVKESKDSEFLTRPISFQKHQWVRKGFTKKVKVLTTKITKVSAKSIMLYEESAILDKVTVDIKRLRDQHRFVYDRVPHDRID